MNDCKNAKSEQELKKVVDDWSKNDAKKDEKGVGVRQTR
jgi:hypothetical protein